MLHERSSTYRLLKDDKNKLHVHKYKTEKEYKRIYPFLKEVDSKALQSSTRNLIRAFRNFFKGLPTTQKIGYPRFKSRKNKQSYTTYNIDNNTKIDFGTKRVKLPKVKTWIKYKDDRMFKEPIKHVTVSKTKSGTYFVAIIIEKEVDITPKTMIPISKIQAFDMSFPHFLVSTQNRMENPRFYRREEKRLQWLHRRVSRKRKGSNNRNKARIRLARKYDQIYNRKNDWMHKITHDLVKKYDAIILENLNIEGMKHFGKGHAKSVTLDFSWYQFVSALRYKMEQEGKYLVLVDRWFPSSKLCSNCGWKTNKLKLSDRKWTRKKCETTHDRDKNASRNILNEGIKHLKSLGITITNHSTVGTTGSHAWEDNVKHPSDVVVNEPRIHSL